jgi:hypothetical protein
VHVVFFKLEKKKEKKSLRKEKTQNEQNIPHLANAFYINSLLYCIQTYCSNVGP